ncbi:MAG: hypothetical protein ACPGJF_16260 [Sinimarinibacterium flocculans]|uniref:hypothetical protein n=1 Tax=Sinimarinibacterium flocculans TaxID=985250 RepID=UPI003C5DDE71
MRKGHPLVAAVMFLGALAPAVAAGEPLPPPAPARDTGVAAVIADQGNRALLQIRVDMHEALAKRQPPALRGRHGLRPAPALSVIVPGTLGDRHSDA